jgi:hypothetical protein
MLVFGTIVVAAIFLLVGYLVSVEMFQQRVWRRRVQQGDTSILDALIREGLAGWRRGRAPRSLPPNVWAAIQGVELVAVSEDSATVSTSAEPEFRNEGGARVQVRSSLDEAMLVAARLAEMLLYDIPSVGLYEVRVDVYSTFAAPGGAAEQRPILSLTADRPTADDLEWEALAPEEILARFETIYDRGAEGEGRPIELPPLDADSAETAPAPGGPGSTQQETTWDTSAF